jgi:hypothetical protein
VVQLLNRLVDLDEILYGDDIEYDLDSMLFNPVASTISKWRTFKLLRAHLLTDWWIWMKFCIVVMALKVTSIIPKWLSVCPPLITFEPLLNFHEFW